MIKKVKWKALVLCFVFILSALALPGFVSPAIAAPDSGDGSEANPYIINEPSDLVWMGENYASIRTKSFRQTVDIDMTGVAFTPIGNGTTAQSDSGNPFTGTYDGQGYQIKNLTISSNLSNVAMFQSVGDGVNGTVKNVVLYNASITSTSSAPYYACVSGISSFTNQGIISGCSVSGSISMNGTSTSSYAAGLTAYYAGKIYDSCCTAAISNVNADANAIMAGISGYVGQNNEIKRCYFAGSLNGAAPIKGAIVSINYMGIYQNNVYLDSSASYANAGDSNNTGATRATSAQMKTASTYTSVGWNFTTVWKINAGVSYPQHITTPGKPGGVASVESDGQLAISWNAVSGASGYNLYIGTAAGVYGAPVAVSGTSKTVTGLTNGTTYYVAVKALHTAEEGAASNEITAVPHKTLTDLAATANSNRVDLTFSAPEGAVAVELQQSTGGAFTTVAGLSLTAASTSAAVTGLANGTEYSFKLRLDYGNGVYYSNTVTIKAGNSINQLSALSTTGCTLSPGFSPTVYGYTSSVGSNVSSITVTATKQGSLSSMTIGGIAQASGVAKTVALANGENTIEIVVTAQNGVARSYNLIVNRAYSGAALTRVADNWADTWGGNGPILYAGHYEPDVEEAALKFDLTGYTDELVAATLKIYVNNDPTDSGLGGIGEGQFDLYGSDDDAWTTDGPLSHQATALASVEGALPDGWKSFDVTSFVMAEYAGDMVACFYFAGRDIGGKNDIGFYSPVASNGDKRACIVLTFVSSDTRLAVVTVGGADLPGFTPGTYFYNYVAPHDTDVSTLAFASVVNDVNATQGSWTYDGAATTWSNTVTAQNGDVKTYVVHVSAALSADATLSGIKVGGADLAGFAPGTVNYTYYVAHGTNIAGLAFASTVNDHMAAQGSWSYDSGTKKWSVTVTAEDGTTKTYTVTIHELPSTDATLADIEVGGMALAGFAPNIVNYAYNVAHGTDIAGLVFTSTKNDHMATPGSWTYAASTKKWSITITAEDGTTTKTYTVTVNELPSTDATLSGIQVNGVPLAGFTSGTLSYTYNVAHGTNIAALVFTGNVHDHMAVQSSWIYTASTHKWSVTVTAEDGSTTKIYAVTVNELPSTDATLSGIKVDGADLAGFTANTVIYTITVEHGTNIAGFVFTSTVHDHMAVQGSWVYDSGLKKWSVVVTAEDGSTTKAYTVTVNELPSADATLGNIQIGGINLAGFIASTVNYTYNVVHGTDIAFLVFSSTVHDHMATESSWAYDSGLKKWGVIVTAEDGTTTKTYTVTVNELPSTDATLSGIQVNGVPLAGFTSGTLSYTYNVAHGTNIAALVFTGNVHDHMATQGSWAYDAAFKQWSVIITAEDGTTKKTYTVIINELPSTDAALGGIQVGGANLAGFAPGTVSYTVDVPHGTDNTSLLFTSAVHDHMATQCSWTYDATAKQWSVSVTAEDGTTKRTYTVTINELPSTDAALGSIQVGGVALAGFTSNIYNHTYKVVRGTDISALVITSVVHDHMATQSSWSYDAATKQWSVTVTAEDGTTKKIYIVTVNEVGTDATLAGITIAGASLPGFAPDTCDYTVNVAHGTNIAGLALAGMATDPAAHVGVWAYDATASKWSVIVTAEDGTTTLNYSVTVAELPSTNAALSAIRINGVTVAGFSPTKLDYTANVAHGTNPAALVLTSQTADHMATQGAWAYNAAAKKWGVTITAEDGTTNKTYTVVINVLPSSNATLAYIQLDGENMEGFNPLVTSYTSTVPYGTDISALSFTGEPTDDLATIGNWQYNETTHKWSVTVTAENGVSTRTYVITVLFSPASTATVKPSPSPSSAEAGTAEATATDIVAGTPAPTGTIPPNGEPELTPDAVMTVSIVVTDGQSLISAATFVLDGVQKTTDADGMVRYELSGGTFTYTVDAAGYNSTSGSITLSRPNSVICVILAKEGTVVLHANDSGDTGEGGAPPDGSAVLIADQSALPQNESMLLVINEIPSALTDTTAVQQAAGSQYEIAGLFDIYLLVDTQRVQPNTPMRIGLSIPQNLQGTGLQIVRINDDGTITRFDTLQVGGILFFTADHFGKYAIIAVMPAAAALPLWLVLMLATLLLILVILTVYLLRLKRKKA